MRPLLRPVLLALWTTALAAVVANLIVLLGGQAANGAAIVVTMQGTSLPIDFGPVIGASIAGAVLGAVGALVLVGILPRRGLLVFTIAGVILAGLSLTATTAATTPTGVATLVGMHVVTATIVIVGNAVIHSKAKSRAAISPR